MKRNLIYIFSIIVLSAACVKENLNPDGGSGDVTETDRIPISVGANVIPMDRTKSNLIYDIDGLRNSGKNMSLYSYAFFNGSDKSKSILEDAKLSWNGASWTYSPLQYWITSADQYHFSTIYPFLQGRLSPSFTYPSGSDEYLLGLQPKVYPMYERWSAEDYAQGNIVYKSSKNLYLTTSMDDVMFGDIHVSPEQFGDDVNIEMQHAACAVRFRLRNLTESPFTLTNWYMTGLKNHADMVFYIIDCPEQYEPLRFMTVVPDQKIEKVKVTSFGQTNAKDSVKFKGESDWTVCADGGVSPGNDDYYKYVVLSSRLKQIGSAYGLSHTHSEDGLTITYYDGTGASWTDPNEFMSESTKYKMALKEVQDYYKYTFPNDTSSIFWGPAHYLDADNFFIPLVYEKGAQIMDFDFDQERGDSGDYDLKIHQFECRSHMYQESSTWKANGGLYMTVSGDNCANLYSPYFFSAESHLAIDTSGVVKTWQGDWKEGMGDATTTPHTPYRWYDADPNYNVNEDGKQRSVFLWTAKNTDPTTPLNVETCLANFNAGNGEYTTSVKGGDLATVLDDRGYILLYPQNLTNLEFHFFTAPDTSGGTDPSTATYAKAPDYHSFALKDYTPGGEWLSGYQYDYLITVSTSAVLMQLDVEPWNEREINLD